MKFEYLHPRDEIIEIINRVYRTGMTTTSGGNLSIMDDDGCIWITPSGIDKGTLTPKDIVKVFPDMTYEGIHVPSSELPFHSEMYKVRPDVKAIVHAHPPALVAFAIARKVPDTTVIPKASEICGKAGYSEYALPGSQKLGKIIADKFVEGYETVMMENHGAVAVGTSLLHAFQRLETLEYCARIILKGKTIGKVKTLTEEQIGLSQKGFTLDAFEPQFHSSKEKDLRKLMCQFIHRSYSQKLVTSLEGTFSARVENDEFIITPVGVDRKYIQEEELVLIKGGKKESGKIPSRSVKLHQAIYDKYPNINSIIISHPPNILAYAVTDNDFDSRTIPESYIVLREIVKVPYGAQYEHDNLSENIIVNSITKSTPIILCENDCIIVTGESLVQSFDRLEVAEFSAQSVIESKVLGGVVPIGDVEAEEIKTAYKL